MSGYIHTFYATEHSESSPAVTSLLLSQPGAVQGHNWLICVSGVWIKILRVLLCSGIHRTSVEAMFLSMYIFFSFWLPIVRTLGEAQSFRFCPLVLCLYVGGTAIDTHLAELQCCQSYLCFRNSH